MPAAGWRNWGAERKEKEGNLLFTVYTLISFDLKLCVHIPLKNMGSGNIHRKYVWRTTQQMVLDQSINYLWNKVLPSPYTHINTDWTREIKD